MVCGPPKAGTDNFHKNGGNVLWTDILLITPNQKWNKEVPSQTTFWIKNQEDANGLLIFVALHLPHGSQRHSWTRKLSLWEEGCGSGTAAARRRFAF